MFSWLYKRIYNGFVNEVKENPDAIKGAIMDAIGLGKQESSESEPKGSNQSELLAVPRPEYAVQPQLDDYPGREDEDGDPIMSKLQHLLRDAKSLTEVASIRKELAARENDLQSLANAQMRHERAIKANRASQRAGREEENEPRSSEGMRMDIRNLAPHADDIVDEVGNLIEGFQKGAGDTFRKMFGGTVAATIREHPDLVGKALDRFSSFTKNMGGSQRALPSGSMSSGKYITMDGKDASRPETWAQ